MKQKWIRLFQISDRCDLEQSLNEFLRDYPDCEIKVWNSTCYWYASVIYSDSEEPTYLKQNS